MTENPKYTVPTYDPDALEENRRSDFTRRIPTGLSGKQMARDMKIAQQIIRAAELGADDGGGQDVVGIFIRKAKLLSNPRYWEVMRTVWVAAGTTATAQTFRRMMKSARPCKSWFMTPEDAEELEKMAFPMPVWRAYDPQDGVSDPGISWTTDRRWCEEYAAAKGRVIKERQVRRDEVFAYISRRGESEIIILD